MSWSGDGEGLFFLVVADGWRSLGTEVMFSPDGADLIAVGAYGRRFRSYLEIDEAGPTARREGS